jgi:hypothetical protein
LDTLLCEGCEILPHQNHTSSLMSWTREKKANLESSVEIVNLRIHHSSWHLGLFLSSNTNAFFGRLTNRFQLYRPLSHHTRWRLSLFLCLCLCLSLSWASGFRVYYYYEFFKAKNENNNNFSAGNAMPKCVTAIGCLIISYVSSVTPPLSDEQKCHIL